MFVLARTVKKGDVFVIQMEIKTLGKDFLVNTRLKITKEHKNICRKSLCSFGINYWSLQCIANNK
jgi:hypothetical protein